MNASNYRWAIVAAGGLLGCVAIGAFLIAMTFRPFPKEPREAVAA